MGGLEIVDIERGPRGGVLRWGVYTDEMLVFESPDRSSCLGFVRGAEWAHRLSQVPNLVTLDRHVLLGLLEPLRLAHVYALKDSHPEELEDFKPEKWNGYEIEYARSASASYRALLDAIIAHDESKTTA